MRIPATDLLMTATICGCCPHLWRLHICGCPQGFVDGRRHAGPIKPSSRTNGSRFGRIRFKRIRVESILAELSASPHIARVLETTSRCHGGTCQTLGDLQTFSDEKQAPSHCDHVRHESFFHCVASTLRSNILGKPTTDGRHDKPARPQVFGMA